MPIEQPDDILDALKATAAVLRDAKVDFALAGGLSAWAHGGPATEHDVDLVIREADRDAALSALRDAGLRTCEPPEGWLVKAWQGDVLVDLIYRPRGMEIDEAFLARCEVMNVHAQDMRVISLDDLIVGKLLVLSEHNLDFGPPLEWSRALREQICWTEVRRRTRESPFARTFLHLLVELDVLDADGELNLE